MTTTALAAPAAPGRAGADPLTKWAHVAAEPPRERAFDQRVPGIPGDGSPVVLHVDDARGLTFTWYDISRREQDWCSRERGYLVSRLEVTDASGEAVGWLNVTHTTRELVAAELPTALHWADENTGTSFGFRYGGLTPQRLWASAWTALHEFPASVRGKSLWVLTANDAPQDPAVLAAELDDAERRFERQVRAFVKFLSVPFVDYSYLTESHVDASGRVVPLRGTGVGRLMYLMAARRLAEHGKVLRASGVRSDLATSLWSRLEADPDVPTRDVTVRYWSPALSRPKTYPCIDFTDTVSTEEPHA